MAMMMSKIMMAMMIIKVMMTRLARKMVVMVTLNLKKNFRIW